MKVSVSLPSDDVEFLDEYAKTHGYDSRSAVVHAAVRMLRSAKLGDAYEQVWAIIQRHKQELTEALADMRDA